MKKKKKTTLTRSSIAANVINELDKIAKLKIIDMEEFKKTKIRAEELEKTIVSKKELSQLDPLHAVYAYSQNKMSVFVEQLSALPAASRLVNVCIDAEREYMPTGPPISPLTLSYFSCWSFFDLCIGVKEESFGTIAIQVCKALNVDDGLIKIFSKMQSSRMGLYVHEGFSNQHVLLREMVTERKINAIVPSGYRGQPGEIWLVRILPDPFDERPFGYSVVFTTPYVIGKVEKNFFYQVGDEPGWQAFFDRTLGMTGNLDRTAAYQHLMKYGLNRHYWNEYIFEAYVNHVNEAIYLTGFPDIPKSRPHSRENSRFI